VITVLRSPFGLAMTAHVIAVVALLLAVGAGAPGRVQLALTAGALITAGWAAVARVILAREAQARITADVDLALRMTS
jgi:hypothetical protein